MRITGEAFSFLLSHLAFDANIGACNSYFFHPLLCIVRSWPVQTVDTEVPDVGVVSLPANNFHGSLVGSEFLGLEIEAGNYFPRLAYDKLVPTNELKAKKSESKEVRGR